MPKLIQLKTLSDSRGALTVIEKVLPFDIKRVYYIYKSDPRQVRGGHRHKITCQALICLNGSCCVKTHDGDKIEEFNLNHPDLCLIVEPRDFHTMYRFENDAVLLVLASEFFDDGDYIDEPYPGWKDEIND